ncbi:PocR ligand-binding domain-containing protein [Anaerovorax sp. IOR16]|uniref:PocR ligand-binding domain-containing protein n=1 Tax=Anaerovorax sp. IOR16 TaxID=2773458 RepID=UPI0019D29257|nr:PocR ligand-binding domain-containing protein [Anaerovorax sp. IOR16]
MDTIRSIHDIIDTEELQNIQDNFAESVGMAFITVDYKGKPVTKQSGFTEFCARGRKNPNFKDLCYQCDAHGGLHAAITGKPHIYICHAGLIDFAVPLIYEDNYYGAIMGGQISTNYENLEDSLQLEKVIERKTNWEDLPEIVEAYNSVNKISLNRIKAVVNLMFEYMQNLMEKGNLQCVQDELELKQLEVLEEKRIRLDLEKRIKETKFLSSFGLKYSSLFSILSVISRLAYLENAKRTENSIYILANMLRYTAENINNQISTLGDEITYVENYLKLQSIRLENRLKFKINVDEQFYNVSCPLMIIQPIVAYAIEFAIEPKKQGGEIKINCVQKENDIIVSIEDNGIGIPVDTIENIMNEDSIMNLEMDRFELYKINKCLVGLFGKKYKLMIKKLTDEVGTMVNLRLPINSI